MAAPLCVRPTRDQLEALGKMAPKLGDADLEDDRFLVWQDPDNGEIEVGDADRNYRVTTDGRVL